MARNLKRKRQTQLGFSPVPSSSPAAQGYPKQIQDRAAMVTFDGASPVKKRKVQSGVNDDVPHSLRAPMPTPAGTVEQNGKPAEISSDSDSEPLESTQKRGGAFSSKRRKGKQQQLKFAGTHDAPGSSINVSSPTAPKSSQRMFGKSKSTKGSSDESEELPSPDKMAPQAQTKKGEKRGKNKGGKSKGRVTRSQQRPSAIEDDEDEDEVIAVKSKPQVIDNDDEDSEDAMPTTSGKQRRQRAQQARESSFVSSSPPRAIDSDDEVQVIEQPRKRKASEVPENDDEDGEDDDDEEDEVPKTPGRRKLQRPRRVLTQQEQEELNEDLDFLAPSEEESDSERRAPRNTQSAAKNARQSALEKLKRKRTKQPDEPVVIEDDEEEDGVIGYPDDGEDHDDGGAEVEDEDEDSEAEATIPPKPTSSREFFREEDEDAEFLVDEDEENDLGVPKGIPLAFTRYASMKPKELFKFAVEFMVQKKINPAFQMDDEIYELTFRKLDDEVRGLAGSKFTSAAWTPEYTKQLRARPEIAIVEIDRHNPEHFMNDHCDACNRSGHPATFEIQFQGKPYNRHTLEDVGGDNDEDDSDSDSDSESTNSAGKPNPDDQPAYDAQGIEIAPANTIYYVGKFCKANSETAHSLQHWRYALNEFVMTWLIGKGYDRAAKVVERDRWSTKKRRKEANRIVDRMEKENVVANLWKEFRATVASARDSKQGRF
ncbi:hypothetical protein MBLNU230_g4525t1 [Neophaeotheca triangularis]